VPSLGLPEGRLAVCLLGGGHDGGDLAEAFVRARPPEGTSLVVLTGPFMPPEARQRVYAHAANHPHIRVLEFLSEPALLLRGADRVIAMGGYNTIYEMLSFDKRALVVPRVSPGLEQLIRAERLRALGAVDMLRPEEATPAALTAWLHSEPASRPGIRQRIDFGGTERLPALVDALFEDGARTAEVAHVVAE
jgi:predicted glycosyltransferase